MNTVKFASHPYANARVNFYDDGSIALVSYRTVVAEIAPDNTLRVNGLYSNTTRRHIGWFMHEFVRFPNGSCGSYQLARQLYDDGLMMNLDTGEVLPV